MRRARYIEGALPIEALPFDVKLYCVYGNPAFPNAMCCKLRARPGYRTIWSQSVDNNRIGFNGLGDEFEGWRARHRFCYFFLDIDHAVALVRELIQPIRP